MWKIVMQIIDKSMNYWLKTFQIGIIVRWWPLLAKCDIAASFVKHFIQTEGKKEAKF